MSFRFLTAGESHGPALFAIIEGLPAGLPDPSERIDRDLARRQQGYGRSKRMQMERDHVLIRAGLVGGQTYGAPLLLEIPNSEQTQKDLRTLAPMPVPRPGHADYAAAVRYDTHDVAPLWERSSARESAARVAIGGVAKALLNACQIEVVSHVLAIGGVQAHPVRDDSLPARAESSPVRCADPAAEEAICRAIDAAGDAGETLGGVIEVVVSRLPAGLGSCMHWDQRLDAQLSASLLSMPSAKAVEFGDGITVAGLGGASAHDELFHTPERGFFHETNRAGGLEGGITNGAPLVCRVFCKPIPTLRAPLRSVDLSTHEAARAPYRRSDVCAVPAAAVIAEALVAIPLAQALLARSGATHLRELASFAAHTRARALPSL